MKFQWVMNINNFIFNKSLCNKIIKYKILNIKKKKNLQDSKVFATQREISDLESTI